MFFFSTLYVGFLVPQTGIKPAPQQGEDEVLMSGLPENFPYNPFGSESIHRAIGSIKVEESSFHLVEQTKL